MPKLLESSKHLSARWLPNSSWPLLGRLLVYALGRLGSILEAFRFDFHARMEARYHLNLTNPSSSGKTARKLKTAVLPKCFARQRRVPATVRASKQGGFGSGLSREN